MSKRKRQWMFESLAVGFTTRRKKKKQRRERERLFFFFFFFFAVAEIEKRIERVFQQKRNREKRERRLMRGNEINACEGCFPFVVVWMSRIGLGKIDPTTGNLDVRSKSVV
jgi:hypothetical protein